MFNKSLLTLHLRELRYIVTAVMINKEALRILVTAVNLCCPIQWFYIVGKIETYLKTNQTSPRQRQLFQGSTDFETHVAT